MQCDLDQRIYELKSEERTVTEVSARFACFLKLNAIAAYNDALGDYLDHLIEDEKGKIAVGGEKDTLQRLQDMKAMYEKEVKVLEEACGNRKVNPATAADIKKLYEETLCKLEFSGPMLKNIMNVSDAANAAAAAYSETRIQPRRKQPQRAKVATHVMYPQPLHPGSSTDTEERRGFMGRMFSWTKHKIWK